MRIPLRQTVLIVEVRHLWLKITRAVRHVSEITVPKNIVRSSTSPAAPVSAVFDVRAREILAPYEDSVALFIQIRLCCWEVQLFLLRFWLLVFLSNKDWACGSQANRDFCVWTGSKMLHNNIMVF